MTTMPAMEDVKEKIKKITFEDRAEVVPDLIKEVKTVKLPTAKKINSFNVKNLERRKAVKNQVTAYLLDEELNMLEELYFQKRKQKIKTDRSSIIGEAIKILYKKMVE